MNRSSELNSLNGRVVVNQLCIDQFPGVLSFPCPEKNDTSYSYSSESEGDVFVESTSIDVYAANNKIRRIDVIKIDIEGFELNALKGAKNILASATSKPRLIVAELVDEFLSRSGGTKVEVYEFLLSYGYIPFPISNSVDHPLSRSEFLATTASLFAFKPISQ